MMTPTMSDHVVQPWCWIMATMMVAHQQLQLLRRQLEEYNGGQRCNGVDNNVFSSSALDWTSSPTPPMTLSTKTTPSPWWGGGVLQHPPYRNCVVVVTFALVICPPHSPLNAVALSYISMSRTVPGYAPNNGGDGQWRLWRRDGFYLLCADLIMRSSNFSLELIFFTLFFFPCPPTFLALQHQQSPFLFTDLFYIYCVCQSLPSGITQLFGSFSCRLNIPAWGCKIGAYLLQQKLQNNWVTRWVKDVCNIGASTAPHHHLPAQAATNHVVSMECLPWDDMCNLQHNAMQRLHHRDNKLY